MAELSRPSVADLHKRWAKLEDEQHQLTIAIRRDSIRGLPTEPARKQQAGLLLRINALVAAMLDAPATTIEDCMALADVAFEHELDLPADIARYGPADYPMMACLLRALARQAPAFEFNSFRRWLSPDQFQEFMGARPQPKQRLTR